MPKVNNGIVFSTAIFLYKVNNAGAFEVVESGSKLGCVVIGTGTDLGFEILVYNGQKVPQARIPITASFTYKMTALYCSCSDASGAHFSLLFDNEGVLASSKGPWWRR